MPKKKPPKYSEREMVVYHPDGIKTDKYTFILSIQQIYRDKSKDSSGKKWFYKGDLLVKYFVGESSAKFLLGVSGIPENNLEGILKLEEVNVDSQFYRELTEGLPKDILDVLEQQ